MKFTTAGDYMADYDGMLGTTDTNFVSSDIEENAPSGEYLKRLNEEAKQKAEKNGSFRNPGSWREPGKFQSVTTTVRDKEQIYDIKVEREVAEIINTILLRENSLMRYELNIKFPWETE